MNERIRELAVKAGEYVNSVYTPPVRSKEPGKIWEAGHVDWHTQFNQKFAELIVRECIQAVKNVGGYNEDYHMNAIKKYFGVEE
jgi:hypothetical protein